MGNKSEQARHCIVVLFIRIPLVDLVQLTILTTLNVILVVVVCLLSLSLLLPFLLLSVVVM